MSDEGERTARWPARSRTASGHADEGRGDRTRGVDEPAANRGGRVDGRERDRNGSDCRCEATFHDDQLVVDSEACPGRGRLASEPACRETVIDALSVRDATAVCVRVDDTERACGAAAAGFLLAAGRFAERCAPHDPALATRVRRDPLAGARLAAGRSDSVGEIAAETGFLEGAFRFGSYCEAFGDRDTYRVRDSRRHPDRWGSSRFEAGAGRAERTARVLDDGERGGWHRRRHDDSFLPPH